MDSAIFFVRRLRHLWLTIVFLSAATASYALWDSAEGSVSGWKESPWLGWLHSEGYGPGWIYHEQHGFMYATGTSDSSVWFWNEAYGWQWTNQSNYPYFYNTEASSWRLFDQNSSFQEQWFYDFSAGEWFSGELLQGLAPTAFDQGAGGFAGIIDLGLANAGFSDFGFRDDGTFYVSFFGTESGISVSGTVNGTYLYKKSKTNANQASFSMTLTTMSFSGGGQSFSGTMQQIAQTAGEAAPEHFSVTLTFTSREHGSYTGEIIYTNGFREGDSGTF